MPASNDSAFAVSAATFTAAAMIAQQVSGKATRDALFLSHYDIQALPYMFIGSSLFSLVMVFFFSRLLTRYGPNRVLPIFFAASTAAFLGEWILLGIRPHAAVVLVYLHMGGLGGVLISGFWSLVNERFDPRTAKRQIGRIAGGATAGGLLGGLLTERVADAFPLGTMLPILGLFHLFCAWRVLGVNKKSVRPSPESGPGKTATQKGSGVPDNQPSAWKVLRRAPYLRNLAILVLLAGTSNICLDYVFKAQAAAVFGEGESLLRFFAIFYTVVSLGTFVAQSTLARRALEGLGLARTVGSLPLVIASGSASALLIPGLPTATLAKGLGSITNDSLYRSGYEIFYTPIPPKEKRATKSFIDVGFDQMGDLIGGAGIRLILLVAPLSSLSIVLGVAIALSLVGLWFIQRLSGGYILSLEQGLRNRALELDLADVMDGTTRMAVIRMSAFDSVAAYPAGQRPDVLVEQSSEGEPQPEPDPPTADPVTTRIAALRSGDPQSVRRVLHEEEGLDVALAPHLIPLLAWDEVAAEVVTALRPLAPRITGQLLDALLDPEQFFAVQRRVPRILAACPTQRVANGLMEGLQSRRFEVRFQCGWALYSILQKTPNLSVPGGTIFEAVQREAAAGMKVWQSHQILDRAEDQDLPPFVDDVLRDRVNRNLEHVFRLLSLALPKEPLQIAFRGLHSGDENLHGIALEYLESVLPPTVRDALWPYLEDRRPSRREPRSREEILATLIRSHESIQLQLATLRSKPADE
jgi:ATP/ADP translocase